MSSSKLYIANSEQYYGILKFLELARNFWEEQGDNVKYREANKYYDTISEQRVLKPGGFEVTVPSEISSFAKESESGVDYRAWEIEELLEEEKGDVKRALRKLKNID